MKKSLSFIFLLLVIFYLIYHNSDSESHVIATTSVPSAETTIGTETNKNTDNYKFSDALSPLSQAIKKEADRISEKYKSVGIQIAVMKNRQLVHTYEYGYSDQKNKIPVTSATKYRVASLAKLVTDSVFMKLCDEGKASIDADISDYLGFKVRNPSYPDIVITPAMLMSHTGTVVDSATFERSRDNGSSLTLQEILSRPETFAKAEPGKYYCYSNFSVAIIGAVCEILTGKNFNDLADEYFFGPLNIDAAYVASELDHPELLANIYGGGGITVESQMSAAFNPTIGQTHHLVQGNLICSAKDYMKFVAMISAHGITENGDRLLSENSVDEMLISRIYAEGLGSGFGIEENKFIFENQIMYSHTGNAYGMHSVYVFNPETGDGITILTSGSTVNYLDSKGIYDICMDYIDIFMK